MQMPGKNIRDLLAAASFSTLALAMPELANAQIADSLQIELQAQPLDQALIAIGQSYGVTVVASEALTRDKVADAISGNMTAETALEQALVGTELSAERLPNGGYVIAAASQTADPQPATSNDAPVRTSDISGEENVSLQTQIVVTGSRIDRTNANAPSPVDVITAEDIAILGLTDTTEALRFVPALNQSISLTTPELGGRTSFAAGAEGTAGLATLNLRGLGVERTLVLVNGRRHVGGVTGLPTVDVTSIPQALVERVEVLTGGGSSVYGADAVSGVVNYIIKDDFEGVEFAANYSLPTTSGGDGYFGSLTLGGNFGEGRGNAVLNAEYQFQDNLQTQDRSFTASNSLPAANSPELAAALGISPDFLNVIVPDRRGPFNPAAGLASFTFLGSAGTAIFGAADGLTEIGGMPTLQVIDRATGEIRPFDFGVPTGQAFFTLGGDGATTFGFAPESDQIPQSERFTINGFADYDITPWLTSFVEAKYTRTDSSSQVLFTLNPNDVPIQLDNPFIPDLVLQQQASLAAQGFETNLVVDNLLSDPNTDIPREAVRETFRIVGGFEGDVSEALNYELSFNYGRTDTTLINNGELIPDRFFAGADVVADPVTGDPICRSDIDPDTPFGTSGFPAPAIPGFNTFAPGDGTCQPINLFGEISDAAANFFLLRTEQTFELEQFVVNGVITGNSSEFFELPAGAIGYAAGFEYRDEQSFYQPDPLQIANLGFLSAFSDDVPISGGFDVIEGFGEVNIPLLADLPFAESLDFTASVRVSDYSSVGTTTAFAFGGVWEPTSDLRIRGSFNRAVRAPNIGELFTPQVTVPGQTLDPCAADQINLGTSTRIANCAALIGGIPDFDGSLSLTSFAVQQTTGGNPDLLEETADTFTVG
ncbi:MAG: TonB-dependent receptor, partial [Pseudomonadota bacterium]